MSSKSLAVEVKGLSKRYILSGQEEKHAYLGDAMLAKLRKPFAKAPKDEFWALKDISFDLEQGEVLGIIGGNGAGKSTMLKILSQIADPTEGEIRMHGRVGSLLEVGTGFHPELTGRENIFLNGTILGMRKREVERHFDEIVEFAEVDRFIDTPVKRYSSGMYVRLAFAVAANLTPEILIVDEVLAVGDAKFQAKCLGKMKQVSQGGGRTVLFVSHSAAAVRTLCTKAVFLKQGRMEFYGDVDEALSLYSGGPKSADTIIDKAEIVNEGLVFEEITVNGSDSTTLELDSDDPRLEISMRGRATMPLQARVGVSIKDTNGLDLASFGEGLITGTVPIVEVGEFEWKVRIEMPRNISEGTYVLSIDVAHPNVKSWVGIDSAVQLIAKSPSNASGHPLRYNDKYGFILLDGTVSRRSSLVEQS